MTTPRTARPAALLAVAALAGCAGSPPAPTPAPPPVVTTAPSASRAPTATPTPSTPRRVVGLGDSIMEGTNCACAGPLAAYADALESSRGVRPQVRNLGVAGWTTGDLREFVATDAAARAAVAEADVVVVIVGANDLFRMGAAGADGPRPTALPRYLTALDAGLDEALDAVRAAHGGGGATFLVAGYWDILAPSGRSDAASAAVTAAVNATIRGAARDAGMGWVDLDAAFADAGGAPGLISDDGLHPNADGVRVIGQAIARATP